MTLLFDAAYLLALLVAWPLLLYRRWRRGPGSLSLGERLGRVPPRPVAASCVWLHGVSLGEINATRTIVEELRRRSPDTVVVVSSTTQTGLTQARNLYPQLCVLRFPLDLSFAVRAAMDRLRPSVIVLMELEVWPNLLRVAAARDIPVLIANGRVTDNRTMRAFRMPILRKLARSMFGSLRWVGAQDAGYAARFIELGVAAARVEITGSVKYDTAPLTDRVDGQEQLAEAMTIDPRRPLWVCGSTGGGEESIILDAYDRLLREYPELQLAIIPRKPESFDEVADLIVQRGYACLRRSGKPPRVPAEPVSPRPVFLGDTMGELRRFYGLATLVFVGRTLVPLGGSDVMEVAGMGKAMIFGPHTENFAEAADALLEAQAARRVATPAGLRGAVDELLKDPQRRAAMGAAAREVVQQRRGATARTVEMILALARR
ncbi:MAG: 3-deoxy-D-manno-octulosonic acid transferase [Planctomycetia bacterium]|nr:MAG: 3-deoxy-D-manno-octulosonic acid transferase [Planctomycetia bacterium]